MAVVMSEEGQIKDQEDDCDDDDGYCAFVAFPQRSVTHQCAACHYTCKHRGFGYHTWHFTDLPCPYHFLTISLPRPYTALSFPYPFPVLTLSFILSFILSLPYPLSCAYLILHPALTMSFSHFLTISLPLTFPCPFPVLTLPFPCPLSCPFPVLSLFFVLSLPCPLSCPISCPYPVLSLSFILSLPCQLRSINLQYCNKKTHTSCPNGKSSKTPETLTI